MNRETGGGPDEKSESSFALSIFCTAADGKDHILLRGDKKYGNRKSERHRRVLLAGKTGGQRVQEVQRRGSEGKEEAQYVLRILKKRSLQLPVWIDMEDNATSGKASKRDLAAACKAFCSTIEEEGYMAGVYASTSWFSTKIGSLGSLRKWVAQYNDKVTYGGTYDMWQYSSTATVAGFSGHRDVNRSYVLFDRQNFLIRPKVNLQIRSGQSLKSKKTGVLNKNGFYRVVRVNAKGNRGYVKGEGWVTVTSKYAQRVPGETFNIETKGNLIVRESPLLSSAKIGVLKKNRKYSVVAISQDGKRGQLKNGGWITVTNKYVKIIP